MNCRVFIAKNLECNSKNQLPAFYLKYSFLNQFQMKLEIKKKYINHVDQNLTTSVPLPSPVPPSRHLSIQKFCKLYKA